MMKNKFTALFISLLLLFPVGFQNSVTIAEIAEPAENTEIVENVQQNTLDEEIAAETEVLNNENESEQENSFKQPTSKRKIIKKFLLAMFGVAISSFLLFFVLTLYNKVRYRVINQVKTPEGETSLKTPDNMTEAVQIFLEKTQWK